MKSHCTHRCSRPATRTGFTLTEMLVSTALVMMIMLMFAQIYGSAVGSIREQRGLSNNDQKARTIETTLRSDLQSMTYRQPSPPFGDVQGIVAIKAGDEPILDSARQRGYLFIAENGASNQDDILQFTMQIRGNQRGDVQSRLNANRFVGKAANLGGTSANDNEPERDDGLDGNGQGSSSAAEVCYFLRGGNLYRRVLLLRDPLLRANSVDSQPTQNVVQSRIYRSSGTSPNPNYSGASFYRDFDYSATRFNGALWFHSVNSLANDLSQTNVPIAMPKYRFGFDINSGNSIDQDSSMPSSRYFGRFTLRETSDSRFNWPGNGSNNPYTRSDLTLDPVDFFIDQFDQNNRIAEDILLTNVESFDVRIFNPSPAADDNDPTTIEDERFYNPPGGTNNNIPFDKTEFDTWHPKASGTSPSRKLFQRRNDFDNMTFGVRKNSNNNSTAANLPTRIIVPALNPRYFTILANGGSPVVSDLGSLSLIYRRSQNPNWVSSGGSPRRSATRTPEFPPIPGTIVLDDGFQWECIDNRIALKAIQITVRFRDVGSSLPRQITVVHSFVE